MSAEPVVAAFVAGYVIFVVVMLAVQIAVCAMIARKAGYSGWWSLTQLVPVVNLVVIVVFALVDWPVQREARRAAALTLPDGRPRLP